MLVHSRRPSRRVPPITWFLLLADGHVLQVRIRHDVPLPMHARFPILIFKFPRWHMRGDVSLLAVSSAGGVGIAQCARRQKGKSSRFPLWSVLVHSRLLTACHRVTFKPTNCKVHVEDAVASPNHLFTRVRHVFRHFVAVDRATTYCMFYVLVRIRFA